MLSPSLCPNCVQSRDTVSSVPEVTSLSELLPEPFKWRTQERMPGSFEMVDGVVKYYVDEACTHEPFPVPGSSLEFFTDMHRSVGLRQWGVDLSDCPSCMHFM